MAGTLFVVATPLGNLGDWSPRAREVCAAADYVLVEDTRVSARLFASFDIRPRTRVFERHRERRETPRVLADLEAGGTIALISDAGTPGIADPGAELVLAALRGGIQVIPIPGPSALSAALSVAGIEQFPVTFHGYPPEAAGAKRTLILEWKAEPGAHILLLPPHDAEAFLGLLAEMLPERTLVLCRELTKLHEEVLCATAAELAAQLKAGERFRGEMTLIVHGATPEARAWELADLIDEGRRLRDAYGLRGRDLSDFLAFRAKVPRRTAYQAVLQLEKPA